MNRFEGAMGKDILIVTLEDHQHGESSMINKTKAKFGGIWLFMSIFFSAVNSVGQPADRICGLPAILKKIPALDSLRANGIKHETALKTTDITAVDYSQQHPIPVVFHVVLTQQQINQLGGVTGINQRIATQMEVINQDFNRANSDSSRIPAPFKPLYGNVGIRFALARTRPSGEAFTDSFELQVTTKTGFELYNNYKSGIGFTEAKYAEAGGLDAWDPSAYLNVWIINPLDTGKASRLAGLTIPPSFTGGQYNISVWEQGIVLHYGAFGRKQRLTDYYVSSADRGRTLTHELGHFFDLWHVWGDDEGACPGDANGGDDRITDTPPQARETYRAPSFPLYDNCTRTGAGIMFMNFMDYTDDAAKYMFTHEQAARARRQILPGAPLYSLTRQPQLLEPGDGPSSGVTIYPNPASDFINIFFETTPQNLKGIALYNMMGQNVYSLKTERALSHYQIDMSGYSSGLYLLQFFYAGKREIRRIQVMR